ncbi:uncharacterized protein C1orf50 homolog [Oscarella lobularis]|uniref:uncharacterized protein C1orf50 homolog n=1 Tax=Oscarella lobularis TaxID=121494 RepID=UPI0033135B27
MAGKNSQDAALVSSDGSASKLMVDPKAVRRQGPYDLVHLAQQVQTADQFIRATAGSKLQQIATQIRFLQAQAHEVLENARRDAQLHHAECNFEKRPGKIYYLYEKPNGKTYFSMLSPEDWGSSAPHEIVGGFRLEMDMSWTPVDDIAERDKEIRAIDRVLSTKNIKDAITLGDEEDS